MCSCCELWALVIGSLILTRVGTMVPTLGTMVPTLVSSPLRNCINLPIWRRDIAKKRFSMWRPSAILYLKNFDFLSNLHARNGNLYLCTNRNRIILGWDTEIKLFSKWRQNVVYHGTPAVCSLQLPLLLCDASTRTIAKRWERTRTHQEWTASEPRFYQEPNQNPNANAMVLYLD